MKNNLKKHFWLFLTILMSILFERDLGSNGLLLQTRIGRILTWIGKIPSFRFILLILFMFAGFYFIRNCLSKQKIHNQPSWVYYLFWGILLVLTLLLYPMLQSFFYFPTLWENRGMSLVICLFVVLSGNVYYRKIKPEEFNCNFRFSPNSIGLEQDSLQYKISAKNVSQGMYLLSDYVNVIALHGAAGYGKSSYARMIIESLEKNRILYSYISLTETNEAKAFSKLFSERWNETLSAKYPKLLVAEYFPLRRLIFRESGQNALFEIMNYLLTFNFGLIKTKMKTYDKYISHKDNFVTGRIANLFGNVVEFNEDFWVVIIDEIERSPVVETYRVIEMIERFRAEGRNGLPIKMVFLICIGNDFDGLMKIEENKELRYLVSKFIVNDPKSISQHLFLPPITSDLKRDFIFNLISEFKEKNKIKGEPQKRQDIEWGYYTVFGREPLSAFDSIKFIVDILADESPRLITTCLSEVSFFYKTFRNLEGIERTDAIRFSDILLISYIKIKFSNLVTFFIRTAPGVASRSDMVFEGEEMIYAPMQTEKEEDKNEEPKDKLMRWIAKVLEIPEDEYADWEKENIIMASLVAMVSRSYVDKVDRIYEPESAITYDGTLSDPAKLMDYLMLVSDFVKDTKKHFVNMYREHQDRRLEFDNIPNEELVEYSRFLRDIKKTKASLNLDVANELSKRIVSNVIKLIPIQVESDYIRNRAVYQFFFQLVEILEQHQNNKNLKEETKQAIDLFINFLSSDSVNTRSKFAILSSFVNRERGGGFDIHFRLQKSFEIMKRFKNKEIFAAIQHVFKEVDERYLSGNEIIYEKEDNFFYVLYQSWSGKKDNTMELRRIHEAAARGLKDSLRAIKLYWSKFPAPPGANTYDEAVEDDYIFGSETREFSITLVKLIEISEQKLNDFNDDEKRKIELWKKIINDKEEAEKYYKRCSVKDKTDTLASFLIRNGYLTDWGETSDNENKYS